MGAAFFLGAALAFFAALGFAAAFFLGAAFFLTTYQVWLSNGVLGARFNVVGSGWWGFRAREGLINNPQGFKFQDFGQMGFYRIL